MFNKNSNKTLWIVFAVLLLATILIFSSESTKKERTFNKDIVSIDTASVTEVLLYPKSQKGKEVKIFKNGNQWKVLAENGKEYKTPFGKVKNLLIQILRIKPKRLAARSADKFAKYQVLDSAATRVVVKEGSKEALNLIIGKFAFQQPRSMSTFVRLAGSTDIYEVDGFLDMIFNKTAKNFRDETVIKSDKNKWNKLIFKLPEETFELANTGKNWVLNGQPVDSAKTERVLNTLSSLTNNDYANVEATNLPKKESELTIENDLGEPIVVTAYRDSSNYIIHSSMNKENYFNGKNLGSKIFLNKKSFLPDGKK